MLGDPSPAAIVEAANVDIEPLVARRARRRPRYWTLGRNSSPILDRGRRPDIVHFNSVFIPAHAQLARKQRLNGISYVITPHGGLNLWSGDPARAAAVLSAVLRDENKLYQWSSEGQKLTIEALSPECIAERTLAAYRMYVSSA
jgi:hypothetical protein